VSQVRHADLRQDPHWQDDRSLAEWLHLRQVSASHEKSPSRTKSLRLARQVSTSHDKSPPRITRPAPTSAWVQTHGSGEATNACREANLHIMREQQLAAMQTTYPGRSLKCEPDWPRSHHIAINLRSATRKTQPEALKHPLRRARA
jgi:hypothetical protein